MSGTIRLENPGPAWLEVPEDLPDDVATEWVDAVTEWLRQSWGDAWGERAAAMVPPMLRGSLAERPDAHYVFEVWPLFQPVRLRVQISMLDASTMPDWEAAGYSVVSYDDAPVGPGLQCVRMEDLQGEVEATFVEWRAVFTSGEVALSVLVEPTPVELLNLVLPSLHAMIGTLEVTLPNGSEFRAEPTEYAMVGDDITWPGLRLQEAGLLPEEPDGDVEGAR